MYKTLQTELTDGILTVTINRPDKLNALNHTVLEELDKVLDDYYQNENVKGVIITGSGAKGFVAGADISEFLDLTRDEGMDLARRGQDIFARFEMSAKPVIAAVNGFALGGGCELAMACHIRIASENAKFGQPEVNLGLIPGYGGTQRLVHLIGKGRAMELLLTGNMIDAQTALQYGLVTHVVPQEQLMEKARSVMQLILSKAPVAIAKCIYCANIAAGDVGEGISVRNGFTEEVNAFGDCFGTEDMKEGTSAFLEKRKPVFKGV